MLQLIVVDVSECVCTDPAGPAVHLVGGVAVAAATVVRLLFNVASAALFDSFTTSTYPSITARQGEDRRVAPHLKRGKMLGRQRLEMLLDQDSPFLEIGALMGTVLCA